MDEETYLRFDDAELQRLIALTRIEVVPEYQASLAKLMQPAVLEAHMVDGRIESAEVDDVPWLSSEAVEARFRREAALFMSLDQADSLVEAVHALASLQTCEPIFWILAEARPSPVPST